MTECKLTISGFEFDETERDRAQNLINSYCNKIKEKNLDISEIRLRLKKSRKGKNFLHEAQGDMDSGRKILTSKVQDYNLFSAVSEVFEKLLKEYEHKIRK